MIKFRCHRCRKKIAVPDGYVGRKVKCPGCEIVTIVPDIPGAEAQQEARTGPPPPPTGQAEAPDELAELASIATGDEGYEEYEQYATAEYEQAYAPVRQSIVPPRRRARRQGALGAIGVALFIIAAIVAGLGVYDMINAMDALDLVPETMRSGITTSVIMSFIKDIAIAVACVLCGVMALAVRRLGD